MPQLSAIAKTTPITLTLIVLIVGYFVLQVVMGVSPESPTNLDLVRFGANFLPMTTTTDPWRLLTAGFVHIGIMHLLFNAFALYSLGQSCELILGKWRYLAVFLLSIVGGNLLSLSHTLYRIEDGITINAGASGGIMGLGALLLVISLSSHRLARFLDKKMLAILLGINLVMGFAIDGIDNAGHIGGALTGALLGASIGFFPKGFVALSTLMMVGFGVWLWWLRDAVMALM